MCLDITKNYTYITVVVLVRDLVHVGFDILVLACFMKQPLPFLINSSMFCQDPLRVPLRNFYKACDVFIAQLA